MSVRFSMKRKILFLRFLTLFGLVAIFSFGNSLIGNQSKLHHDQNNAFKHGTFISRHLLEVPSDENTPENKSNDLNQPIPIAKNCVRPDIEQFPKGVFNQNDRIHGAILMHFFMSIYMFIGLAIVCDDYFVPSLQYICKYFNIKEDVAGATFMAAGSSAPELATTMISLFIAKDVDIGIGTVVGSAVFNVMFVISIVALLSGMIITISWYPITRDSLFYLISVFAMILVILDEQVHWYEAFCFLILYVVYVIILVFDSKIQAWAYSHMNFLNKSGLLDSSQLETNNYNTLSNEKNELANFNSNNSLSQAAAAADQAEVLSNKDDLEKNFDPNARIEDFSPFKLPTSDQTRMEKLKFYLCWPLLCILHFTIPDCRKIHLQKYFILTFAMSLVWLCLFSYVMVWMITIIGYTFSIPDSVMGITFIAFGASVPDALSSLLVAKNGFGDMAISNAIGSNVFDILICLGLPWFIRCISVKGHYILVKSKGLTYSSITLFGTVLVLLVTIRLNKWQLDKKLGIFLMVVYLVFITLSSMYELNIFGTNHLPMCLDSLW